MKYLLLVSLVWAFSFSLIKTNLTNIPSDLVSSIRLAMSFIVFLPFLKLRLLKNKTLSIRLLIIGAVQFGLMYVSYIKAFQYLRAYEIALFTIFTPIFVVLINELLDRKLELKSFLAPVLAVIGTGIISYKGLDSSNFWLGFLFMQISNVSFAFGQVAYKRLISKEQIPNRELFSVIYLGAIIFSFIYTAFNSGFSGISNINSSQWLALLYLGVIASGLCFFMWNKGTKTVSTKTLSVMNNLKIPLAVLVSVLIFKEQADLIKLSLGLSVMLVALRVSYMKL